MFFVTFRNVVDAEVRLWMLPANTFQIRNILRFPSRFAPRLARRHESGAGAEQLGHEFSNATAVEGG